MSHDAQGDPRSGASLAPPGEVLEVLGVRAPSEHPLKVADHAMNAIRAFPRSPHWPNRRFGPDCCAVFERPPRARLNNPGQEAEGRLASSRRPPAGGQTSQMGLDHARLPYWSMTVTRQ
jgi:hypothetical protein